MPLVRFQVRNEYGLSDPEVYRTAKKDDSAAILQGVSVAGLVGILRQLGDLAEFAADIFHDLHEQVMATAARSHDMMTRVQYLEAALPPLENHALAQTSHIHFAYTTGSDWRANIRIDQNHLTRSDLPRFILDSYEECRGAPRLYLLDKFDPAGAGACLKRYSDPSFFKMQCASSELTKSEKVRRQKKAHKSKRKVMRQRNGEALDRGSTIWQNNRSNYTPLDADERSYSAESIQTSDERSRSEQAKGSPLFGSLTRTSYIEPVFDADSSMKSDKESDLLSTYVKKQYCDTGPSVPHEEQNAITKDSDFPHHSLHGQSSVESSVSWEEKAEIIEPTIDLCDNILEDYRQASDSLTLSIEPPMLEQKDSILGRFDQQDVYFGGQGPESCSDNTQQDVFFDPPMLEQKASDSLPLSFVPPMLEQKASNLTEFDQQDVFFDPPMLEQKASDSLPLSFAPPMLEQKASNLTEFDQQDGFFGGKRSEFCSGDSQSDGVISESDNYVDALNTMESEIESDSEHQTKQAVKIPVTSYGPSNKEMSRFSYSESSDGLTHAQPPQIIDIPSFAETDCVVSHDLAKELKEPDFISLTSGSSLDHNVHRAKTISINSAAKSEESPPAKTNDVDSMKLWTNGGLLGVEPSKPPDFSAPNYHAIQDSESNIGSKQSSPLIGTDITKPYQDESLGEANNLTKQTSFMNLHPDEFVGEMGNLVPPAEHRVSSISCQDMGVGDKSVNLCSQESVSAVSETKLEAFRIPRRPSAHLNETHGVDSTKTNVEESSGESVQNNFEASILSTMENHDSVPLAHGLTPEEKFKISSPRALIYPKSRYIEHPSPPLEHMKILFDPINDLEISKLKLEFSNGDHLDESIEDALFPSFHLLPGLAIPLQDIGSETDDDTFCRPSPSFSEDLLSQDHESNSEQWESGSKDEIYDGGLCRVSSATSISSSLGLDCIAHHPIQPYYETGSSNVGEGIRSHSGKMLTIPLQRLSGFSVSNSLASHQDERGDSEPKELLGSALPEANGEPPLPPPLPPLQWRIINPNFTLVEDKQNIIPDHTNQPSDPQVPVSVNTEQFKLATLETLQKKAITTYDKNMPKRLGENQPAIDKKLDEREVLLEQIREKSFSLRHTATARPNLMPAPTTNINVVAILEKANAIRQAFAGSDEGGDDDKWSDC